eukprot:gene4798-3440_t
MRGRLSICSWIACRRSGQAMYPFRTARTGLINAEVQSVTEMPMPVPNSHLDVMDVIMDRLDRMDAKIESRFASLEHSAPAAAIPAPSLPAMGPLETSAAPPAATFVAPVPVEDKVVEAEKLESDVHPEFPLLDIDAWKPRLVNFGGGDEWVMWSSTHFKRNIQIHVASIYYTARRDTSLATTLSEYLDKLTNQNVFIASISEQQQYPLHVKAVPTLNIEYIYTLLSPLKAKRLNYLFSLLSIPTYTDAAQRTSPPLIQSDIHQLHQCGIIERVQTFDPSIPAIIPFTVTEEKDGPMEMRPVGRGTRPSWRRRVACEQCLFCDSPSALIDFQPSGHSGNNGLGSSPGFAPPRLPSIATLTGTCPHKKNKRIPKSSVQIYQK